MTMTVANFEPMKLPDPNIARMKGWTHQVDWIDGANPCFYRAKSLLEAEKWADANLLDQRHYIREVLR
jgi:hypothetical protein